MTPCWQSTQTPIKSTFPTKCIHIFAIWCVLIFSQEPLVELFNCHHCKGQQVIFSADPLLLRNSSPAQSYNFISEHSWMIVLSKSGHYCRMNGLTTRTESITSSLSQNNVSSRREATMGRYQKEKKERLRPSLCFHLEAKVGWPVSSFCAIELAPLILC